MGPNEVAEAVIAALKASGNDEAFYSVGRIDDEHGEPSVAIETADGEDYFLAVERG